MSVKTNNRPISYLYRETCGVKDKGRGEKLPTPAEFKTAYDKWKARNGFTQTYREQNAAMATAEARRKQ